MVLNIIIVSFNTSSLLKRCLFSVFKALKFANLNQEAEVIVVDNGSSDGSVEMVKNYFPTVRLIENKKNLGFAKANNQGIRVSRGSFILFLNSDTQIKQESINVMLSEIQKDKKIAVVGCKLLNKDGSIQPSIGYFPSLLKIFLWMSFIDDLPLLSVFLKPYHVDNIHFYKTFHSVDWVSGACFMTRKDVLDEVSFFDEKFFMYGEEMELCFRIKNKGYKIVYTPQTSVYHYKGQSAEKAKVAGIREEFQAIFHFYRKHKPSWQFFVLINLLRFGALLRLVLFDIIKMFPERRNLYAQIYKDCRRLSS